MSKFQKDIQFVERTIEELQKELSENETYLRKLKAVSKEFEGDEKIFEIESFPGKGAKNPPYFYLVSRGKIKTIFDLVYTNPKEILEIEGVGKTCLKNVEKWMDDHGLMFILK